MLIDKLLKVATPLEAVTGFVPLSVPEPGLAPMAMVIEALLLVTVLPKASWTVTWTAGLMLTPATVVLGWTVNASLLAAAGVTLKVLLVAPVSVPLVALRVYPVPVLLIDKLLKVATPLTAFTGVVPLSVPPPGLAPMAMVIEALLPVTVLPKASWTLTWTAGLMLTPATVLLGCWLNASLLAVAAPTLIGLVVPVILLVTVSVAVTVWLPAVFRVTALMKVCVPLSPATKV